MRSLLALVLVAVAAACNGDGPSALDTAHVGTYALTSVNGEGLPYTLFDLDGELVQVASGSLTLEASGRFRDSAVLTVRSDGVTTTESDVIAGTYTHTGDRFDFTSDDGDRYTMTWDGSSRMTQSEQGFVLVYTR